jgi:predicted MPP superfamily phosphohydrolase
MSKLNTIIFFSVFFLLYGLLNSYIFLRGWQVFASDSQLRIPYAILFWILALSFFAGRFLENAAPGVLSTVLVWTGSFWFAAFAYFTLAALLIDILRLLNYTIPFFPSVITSNIPKTKLIVFATVIGAVGIALVAGYFNARTPRLKTLEINIPKKVDSLRSLRVAVASDIHLGTIIGNGRLGKMVDTINSLKPDLILFPGDIVDEDLAPVIRQNLGEKLGSLKAKYGVYAVTGNHEYIGGVEEACKYLTEHDIRVLRDEAVTIAGGITLVGREDRSINQFAGKRRKPLSEIVSGTSDSSVVILMDHQPFGLNEAVEQGVDLQLSGHTHHGQIWPFHLITKAIYEMSWGYKKKESTQFYVSSGAGTWGPPVRLGNIPEIIDLRISFD